MFLIYQRIFQGGCSILYAGFCRFTRNSSCPGISPQRLHARSLEVLASYHFRTVIQLSRYTRENIPQGVTFKTSVFPGFFKTFFKKLDFCSIAQKHPSLGRHLESLKKTTFSETFLFSFKLHNKKSRHIDSTNSGRTFHPLAQFALKLCNGLNFKH